MICGSYDTKIIKEWGNKMRKEIVTVLSFAIGGIVGSGIISNRLGKDLIKKQEMSDKHLSLFLLMNQWVRVYQEKKKIASYFEKNGYKKIAIYGMSFTGRTLLDELKETDIRVIYTIDKNPDNAVEGVPAYSVEDDLKEVDAVIVTAIAYFDEIRDVLEEKVTCPIISLESVIYEV